MDPLARKVRPLKRRTRKKPLSEEIRSMYRVLSITMLFLGVAATGSYLYLNSTRSANGYTLQQLQSNLQGLQSDQRSLDHQIVEAQSFLNIEGTQQIENMQESNNEDFSYLGDQNNFAQNQ